VRAEFAVMQVLRKQAASADCIIVNCMVKELGLFYQLHFGLNLKFISV
jgi:hypothetical protein